MGRGRRFSNTSYLTHPAGRKSIVSLHAHQKRDSRDVSNDNDEIGMENEQCFGERVESLNTNFELKELLNQRIEERIHIRWFLGPRNDTDGDKILFVEPDVRR